MKKILLLILFVFTIAVNAQDDSYVNFTPAQEEKSKTISATKTGSTVTFESGMDYDGTLFWYVTAADGKEYYFNCTKEFTEIKHAEAKYSSLMEYVIENIGF